MALFEFFLELTKQTNTTGTGINACNQIYIYISTHIKYNKYMYLYKTYYVIIN